MATAPSSPAPAHVVRAAFAEHRVASAWNMVAGCSGMERLAALDAFERLLGSRGISLADIPAAMAASKQAPEPTSFTSPFADVFADAFAGFGRTPAATPPAPARRPSPRRVSGADIPAQIHGLATILDERPLRTGEMLVVEIRTPGLGDAEPDVVHGPIAVFAGATIAKLREAAAKDAPRYVCLKVEQPTRAGMSPVAKAGWFA